MRQEAHRQLELVESKAADRHPRDSTATRSGAPTCGHKKNGADPNSSEIHHGTRPPGDHVAEFAPTAIGVDTAIFIYWIEEDPRFLPLVEPLFEDVAAGKREVVTTPDALQLAAAMSAGCRTFVTNDRRIPAIRGIRVLQPGDYAP
jgi:hypothetical protein